MRRISLKGLLPILAGLAFLIVTFGPAVDPNRRQDVDDAKNLPVEEFLLDRLDRGAELIYLDFYHLSEEAFQDVWQTVLYNHPELFYVSSSYKYAATNLKILHLEPEYTMDEEARSVAKKNYSLALETILQDVDSQWSDLETALYLHDWVALNCAYDETLDHYSAYDLFTLGTGVCQAYALAYQALLEECGIPCQYVASKTMNHAWTEICLDGTWYHVDPTYDDPVFDRRGHVQHTFFLKSDATFQETHTDADAPYPCDSDAYDDALWNDVTSAFIPVNGTFYCISGNHICRWDETGFTPLLTISDLWYVINEPYAYWDGCFSALATDGTNLLYNTPKEIRRYEPDTGRTQTLYTYDESWHIYGFTYRDGLLTCQVAPDPNSPGESIKISLTE